MRHRNSKTLKEKLFEPRKKEKERYDITYMVHTESSLYE